MLIQEQEPCMLRDSGSSAAPSQGEAGVSIISGLIFSVSSASSSLC